jgi:cytochrome bd-type quinol oxidase subunit 1
VALLALWGAWLVHRKKIEHSRWFLAVAVWAVIAPFLMNTAGWLLTESGRQPWIVQGLMKTANASSPSVTSTDIWISLVVFVLAYIVLGIADGYLMIRYGRRELSEEQAPSGEDESDADSAHEPALVY